MTPPAQTTDTESFAPPPRFTDPHRATRLAEGFPKLDSVFEAFCARHRVPGLAYGVVVDGALAYSSGVGVADLSTGATPTADTVFRIASMTKSFTAASVLMLRDDGLLALDDPVAAHVPELTSLRLPTADSPPVTIRSLLSMSAGLVEDDPWGDRLLDLSAPGFDALLAGPLGFDRVPGVAFEYSNLGYAILGRVVARVAGEPLRDFTRRRIFEPLRMSDTTWDADGVPAGKAAVGYRMQDGTFVPEPPLADGAFGAMGGIATTVNDLSRYVAMHLSAWPPRDDPDPGPLRRASLREMATLHTSIVPEPPDGSPSVDEPVTPLVEGYGYGLFCAVHPRFGDSVGHGGALPGFGSYMGWLPERGVGVVAFANRTYVPVRRAVDAAFDVLASTGGMSARTPVPSAALLAARDAVTRLYEAWDDELAAGTFLATYFLDLDDVNRSPDFARLRDRFGPCRSVADVVPTGALRGSWRMDCERGSVELTVMLGPTVPARVQSLRARALPAGG